MQGLILCLQDYVRSTIVYSNVCAQGSRQDGTILEGFEWIKWRSLTWLTQVLLEEMLR